MLILEKHKYLKHNSVNNLTPFKNLQRNLKNLSKYFQIIVIISFSYLYVRNCVIFRKRKCLRRNLM